MNSLKYKIKQIIRKIYYSGSKYKCPICNYKARIFLDIGLYNKRKNGMCPSCRSIERDRILWLFIQNNIVNDTNLSVLHFAPGRALSWVFKKNSESFEYRTSEYGESKIADYSLDLQDLSSLNRRFDLVICSHVLEHVNDDLKAIIELEKILKNDGRLLIIVPIWPSEKHPTYENSLITDSRDRIINFGQYDHLRIYGLDIVDRLNSGGLEVKMVDYVDTISSETASYNRLVNESGIRELIFDCRRRG